MDFVVYTSQELADANKGEGYCMFYSDYFVDDPLHADVIFRQCQDEYEASSENCQESEEDRLLQA
jgi:hypothetical protein